MVNTVLFCPFFLALLSRPFKATFFHLDLLSYPKPKGLLWGEPRDKLIFCHRWWPFKVPNTQLRVVKRPEKPDVIEMDMIIHLPLAYTQKHSTEYSSPQSRLGGKAISTAFSLERLQRIPKLANIYEIVKLNILWDFIADTNTNCICSVTFTWYNCISIKLRRTKLHLLLLSCINKIMSFLGVYFS